MRQVLISAFILFVLFNSCDKIDDPFPPVLDVVDTGITWDDSVFSPENAGKRFVLMEEYTGHLCQACPAGAREIVRLVNKYGEEFIPMSIHATEAFAAPQPGAAPGFPNSFTSDYRTEEGDIYEKEFDIPSLPAGIVSRLKVGDGNVYKLNTGQWEGEALKIMGEAAVANLSIANYYDDSTKTYQVRIGIEWLGEYTGDLSLQVQLLEDSIVDWQKDGPEYVPDYVHRHMFRESLNGVWGESLPAASNGETTEMTYTRAFDPGGIGYKLEHMIVVAFLYKTSPDYNVMQVNEAHLIHH